MHIDKKVNKNKRYSTESESVKKEPMTNQKLREAVVSRDTFDKMYMVSRLSC
jgi:hypothetical protein